MFATPKAFFPLNDSGLCLEDDDAANTHAALLQAASMAATRRPTLNAAPPATLHQSKPQLPAFAPTATNKQSGASASRISSGSSNTCSHSSSPSSVSDLLAATPNASTSLPGLSADAVKESGDAPVAANDAELGSNLYVASLPSTFTDEELYALFSPFGPIVSSKVMYSKASSSGRPLCKGYGFVLFRRETDAARAQSLMIGHIVGGNRIQVRRAKVGRDPLPTGVDAALNVPRNAPASLGVVPPPTRQAIVTAAFPQPQPQALPQPQYLQPQPQPVFVHALPAPQPVVMSPSFASPAGGSMKVVVDDGRYYYLVPAPNVFVSPY